MATASWDRRWRDYFRLAGDTSTISASGSNALFGYPRPMRNHYSGREFDGECRLTDVSSVMGVRRYSDAKPIIFSTIDQKPKVRRLDLRSVARIWRVFWDARTGQGQRADR